MGGILQSLGFGLPGNAYATPETDAVSKSILDIMKDRMNRNDIQRNNAQINTRNDRIRQQARADEALKQEQTMYGDQETQANTLGAQLRQSIESQGMGRYVPNPSGSPGSVMQNPNYNAGADDYVKRLMLESQISHARKENSTNQWLQSGWGGDNILSSQPSHSSMDTQMPPTGPYTKDQLIYGRLNAPQTGDSYDEMLRKLYQMGKP